MSISHLRNSRGYSIAAALILVAVLLLVAVAIQSTLPPMTSPATSPAAMSAATAGSGGIGSDTVATEQAEAKKALAQKCAAAITACQKDASACAAPKDTKADLSSGNINSDCVGAVPDPSSAAKFRCVGLSAKVIYKLPAGSGSPAPIDIQSVPNPNAAPGICKTLICQPDQGISATISYTKLTCSAANMTSLDQNSIASSLTGSGTFTATRTLGSDQFTPTAPLDSNTQNILNSALGKDSTNTSIPYDANNVVAPPAGSEIANLANSNPDTTAQEQSKEITALSCQGNPVMCPGASQSVLDANASADKPTTCMSESCVGGQLGDGRTNPAPPSGSPPPPGTPPPPPSTFSPPPPSTPPPSPSPSGGGLGNALSNLFGGGNNNAANNQPQSPFGGACNTRYVCSGNMLYYQTMGVQYGVPGGSCVTQPVQQCQYGCMAVNGVNGTSGTNGSGSFLSDFGTGLQIASQVLRVFGGGGNSNTLANQNLSSQCAMTPQQAQGYQSPYGTGTDGQQCYQPPQRPDPAQCSSGTWKPTSSSGNGCTTGYQCVPNGSDNGSGSTNTTPPSAQLSCQPQIADVGMPISFSFSCGNADASKGGGFSTGGALSGATTTPAPTPPSGTNQATFTLTCLNQGVTASAQCQVQLNKPGIVLVTNPRVVHSGENALIGWVTAGMHSCAISSPDDQAFNARNAGNTSTNGAATTSPITSGTMNFRLDCQTLAGGTKSATTSVSVQ